MDKAEEIISQLVQRVRKEQAAKTSGAYPATESGTAEYSDKLVNSDEEERKRIAGAGLSALIQHCQLQGELIHTQNMREAAIDTFNRNVALASVRFQRLMHRLFLITMVLLVGFVVMKLFFTPPRLAGQWKLNTTCNGTTVASLLQLLSMEGNFTGTGRDLSGSGSGGVYTIVGQVFNNQISFDKKYLVTNPQTGKTTFGPIAHFQGQLVSAPNQLLAAKGNWNTTKPSDASVPGKGASVDNLTGTWAADQIEIFVP